MLTYEPKKVVDLSVSVLMRVQGKFVRLGKTGKIQSFHVQVVA